MAQNENAGEDKEGSGSAELAHCIICRKFTAAEFRALNSTTHDCLCDPKDSKSYPDVSRLPGPPGAKGEPGSPGVPGLPGLPGRKGNPGEKGAPGMFGLDAPSGRKGMMGVDGTPGTPGKDGSKGDKGSRGVDGQPGTPGQDGMKGEKGDKGDRGVPGYRGMDGLKGAQGEKGQPGSAGLPGIKGEKGMKGDVGTAGPPGQQGEKGEKGVVGTSGAKGVFGKIGQKGMKGFDGPPGPRGSQGPCACSIANDNESDNEYDEVGVAEMSTGKVARACKYIENPDSANEELQLSKDGTMNNLFNAYCEGRKTCLKPKAQNSNITYTETTPFMLSSYRFDPRYEIEKEALLSLQSVSTSAVQHLRIKCLNAYVYSDGDDHKSRSISFVTWNDVMLRSHSTEDNPHYVYTVDKDGCKDSAQEWKVTEFALESKKAERLPITDIYVRDVRGEAQHLYIELGKLCFN